MSMYVFVCFDVEDLVHPDSDDVALDIARLLTNEGITGSLCVVGEKARLWERRERRDVLEAVGRHDVSLHTNQHSMHPVVAEYLADKGWADGVAEAVRQEGPGVRDITRLFGAPPSAWGTPGSSWGPQIPAATRQLGIPANIYSHARAGQTGACWFAGQLCYSVWLHLPGGEDALCDATAFAGALPPLLDQLRGAQRQGMAAVTLFAGHPTRWRYRAFWDGPGLNFNHGEQTAPENYRYAPRRDDAAYAQGLESLRRMLRAVRDLPGVELTTVRALNERWAPENGMLTAQALGRLAQAIVASGAISAEEPLASPAQTLDALARATLARQTGPVTQVSLRTVLGPVEMPPVLAQLVGLSAAQSLEACYQLVAHVDATGHLPTSLLLGGTPVGPGPLLRALAAGFAPPYPLTLIPGAEEPLRAEELAQTAIYQRLPGWPPHPLNLNMDQLALHTRLQNWSLKPATLGHAH
jgi:hypothetical protein